MSPIDRAEAAAEAIRNLTRSVSWPTSEDGYEWPADVDAVVSALGRCAQGTAQALCQAALWLEGAFAMGQVGHDQAGEDGHEAVATAGILLRFAASRAEVLAKDLEGVRQLTSHLTGQPPIGVAGGQRAGQVGSLHLVRGSTSAPVRPEGGDWR